MSKIKRRLIYLALCFSLSCSVAYSSPIDKYDVEQGEMEQTNNENADSADQRLINSLNNQTYNEVDSVTPNSVDTPKSKLSPGSENNMNQELKSKDETQPDSNDNGILHIVLVVGEILNFIFTALVALVFYNRFSPLLKHNTKNSSINKENSSVKSSLVNVENISTSLNDMKKKDSSYNSEINLSSPNEDFGSHRKIDSNNKSSMVNSDALNQNSSSNAMAKVMDIPVDSDKPNKNLTKQQPTILSLTRDFKKMMSDILISESWQSQAIAEKFAAQYGVIALKCTNSSMRVNQPDLPPKFEKSTLDNKLWGIPLTNGRLAVFPNPSLSDYEYSIHYQGGMKELFKVLVVPQYTPYEKGRYTKVTLETPAIMLNNFQIIKQGELHLM